MGRRDIIVALTADEQGGGPTNGVQGFFNERDDNRAHGRDERMMVRSFYESQTFLYELVQALAVTFQNR